MCGSRSSDGAALHAQKPNAAPVKARLDKASSAAARAPDDRRVTAATGASLYTSDTHLAPGVTVMADPDLTLPA